MMFFLRICAMSFRSLLVHPLRSILATLGVIIGVAAVVSAMSILEGMKASFNEGFSTIGTNRLFVLPGQQRRGGRSVGSVETLTLDDCEAIRKECDKVRSATPQINSGGLVRFLSKNSTVAILGTDEQYSAVNNYNPAYGRFINKADVLSDSAVVVLGQKVYKDLFGGRPAIGETIKISGLLGTKGFEVIGVMEEKGNLFFTDVDNQVIIPITTAMNKLYGLKSVGMIMADSVSPETADIDAAKDQIKKLLRRRHRIRPGATDDFQVQAQQEFLAQFQSFQSIIAVVLGSISMISLVVGGIGIMNIMLVAVTERTREIGVRMAMGAQRWDVLKQFLIEAGVVSFFGGSLGVLAGWGLGRTIEQITRIFETVTTSSSVILALAMATGVGLISGIYPAYKASRLDPIEALRYE
ncbi:MAG: ABC transporter permease [Phycisphaerae bacterium]|nr:ABC transporter permease [Phycisphaerae bacterium]NUQ47294.1 ABC transporter permease [Phycisphaerae bacterium]